jgi:hypothetical protein
MTLLRPLYMQPGIGDPAIQYTAQDDRASLLSAVFSREGVLDVDAGQLKVTQRAAGANFSVDIAAGRAAIVGDDVSDQGTYVVTNTATVNLATPVAPGSGTRVHRVIARVKDKLHNGSWTTYEWTLEILQDTGSGTPATPASAISLATISITAGQASVTTTPHIADTRTPASVGTADRSGTFSSAGAAYAVSDVTRPLTWRINPDGWVSLAGWIQWTDVNTTLNAGQFFGITTALPSALRANGIRDFVGLSSHGPLHMRIGGTGVLEYRFQATTTIIQNSSWWSFDGCGYRL